MFSILRYPLFLSLVVDFAVAFQLSWPDGEHYKLFYIGNATANVSWSKNQTDPPNIVLWVTDQDNNTGIWSYTLPDDGRGPDSEAEFEELSIQIPQSVGKFSVAAYIDYGASGVSVSPPPPALATVFFGVQPFPNGPNSTDTGSSQTGITPASTSSSNTPTPTTPVASPTAPPSAGVTSSPVTDLSAGPNKSIIIGSVVGGVIILVLASLLILIAIRRCRTRRDTVQFYENKMVRPAAAVRDPTWEPLRLDSDPDSKDDDPLPEYGYSNYDVIEKADHRPISPLPSGAMSLKPRLPKIIMTPATPSQRDSSVLSSVQPLSLVSEWEPEHAGPSTSVPVPPLPPQIHTASPELQHLQVEINELRREMDESENIGDPAKRQQMMMEIANKLTLLERLVQGRR